jgi:periplasmic protein TonB
MKTILLFGFPLCTVLFLFSAFSPPAMPLNSHAAHELNKPLVSEALKERDDSSRIYTIVEEQAEFPGGIQAMYKFIQSNIVYPDSARIKGISGKCFLKFVVDTLGQIKNIEVLKGVPSCPDCDEEAIRVVRAMPNWIPAKVSGKPVNVFYNLPLVFKTQ